MNDMDLPGWLTDLDPRAAAEAEAATAAAVENDIPPPRPTFVLHPVHGVFWATMLGSFAAGGTIIALNFWRLGARGRAWIAFVVGIAATFAVSALLGAFLESSVRIPSWVIALPQAAVAVAVFKYFHEKRLTEHVRHRGRVASGWSGAGVGILWMLLLLACFLGATWSQTRSLGDRHRFGNDSVYLTAGAEPAHAARLAKLLQDLAYFQNTGVDVQLRRTDGQWAVAFVVNTIALEPEQLSDFERLGHRIAATVLSYPLSIELCDGRLSPLNVLKLEASPYGQVESVEGDCIYFTGGATSSDARKLARILRKMEWLRGDGDVLQLNRTAEGYVLSLLYERKAEQTAEADRAFRATGEFLAESGFGYPITIHLCHTEFSPWKTITIETPPLERPLPTPTTL